MNQLYILLLVLWSAFNLSDAGDPDELTTQDPWQRMSDIFFIGDGDEFEYLDENVWGSRFDEYNTNVPEPNITVYQQTEDREEVIVLCKFGRTYGGQSIELTVKSELKHTIKPLRFCPSYSSEMRVFLVTVRPPASFTCVQEIYSDLDVRNLRTQTYNYSLSVSDHREEGASLLYICFSSFIAVGLFIMTAAVIVINIRSKTKDTNSTAVTDNDYVEA
ncbi:uncharacterized protein LOC127963084 [Carassius gibelio]|uniref:uncharacterized protein LOC127963084 n=1 Tax=Carassius gibelio TaxID=101364 RepID=UPI002278F104|nr:uncharacterized protein LOC127963084 [Carassius gibelio]XP_052418708.1 uncharacterized protein LOC127963084 [Carassius gibelio]